MKIYCVSSYMDAFIDGRMFESTTLYATEEVAKEALKGEAKRLLRRAKENYSLDELTIEEDERSYSVYSEWNEWTVCISEKTVLEEYFEEEEEEEEEEVKEEKLSDLPGTEFLDAIKPLKVEKTTVLSSRLYPDEFANSSNTQWNPCHDIDKIKKKYSPGVVSHMFSDGILDLMSRHPSWESGQVEIVFNTDFNH